MPLDVVDGVQQGPAAMLKWLVLRRCGHIDVVCTHSRCNCGKREPRLHMKKVLASLSLAALMWNPLWAQPSSWAVVVGVDDYTTDLPKLNYAVADAKLFAQVLEQSMHVPKDHIRLMTSDALTEALQPRLTNVLEQVYKLKSKVQPSDTVIFYFAGHGLTVDGQSYLLTEDSDNRSAVTIRNSAIRSSEINQIFDELQAQNGWVILDACRNKVVGN